MRTFGWHIALLAAVFATTARAQGVYTDFGTGVFEPSVWRMQVGVHYAF